MELANLKPPPKDRPWGDPQPPSGSSRFHIPCGVVRTAALWLSAVVLPWGLSKHSSSRLSCLWGLAGEVSGLWRRQQLCSLSLSHKDLLPASGLSESRRRLQGWSSPRSRGHPCPSSCTVILRCPRGRTRRSLWFPGEPGGALPLCERRIGSAEGLGMALPAERQLTQWEVGEDDPSSPSAAPLRPGLWA